MAKKQDKAQDQRHAEGLKALKIPTKDPLFQAFARHWIGVDDRAQAFCLVIAGDAAAAERYAAHQDPSFDHVENAAERMTAVLWSEKSKAAMLEMMAAPTIRLGPHAPYAISLRKTLQEARRVLGVDIIQNHNAAVRGLPVLTARSKDERTGREKRSAKDKENRALGQFEANLAAAMDDGDKRHRFFGSAWDTLVNKLKPLTDAKPEPEEDAYRARYGETREQYHARLTEAGFKAERIAKRVQEREDQL
jgi:hypothetical protein